MSLNIDIQPPAHQPPAQFHERGGNNIADGNQSSQFDLIIHHVKSKFLANIISQPPHLHHTQPTFRAPHAPFQPAHPQAHANTVID